MATVHEVSLYNIQLRKPILGANGNTSLNCLNSIIPVNAESACGVVHDRVVVVCDATRVNVVEWEFVEVVA